MNKVTKLLSVFILAGAVGAGVAGVAGCKSNNNDGGKHTHNYTWEIDPSDNTKCREVCHAEGECDAKVKPSQAHVDEKNNETGATGADGKCDHCGTAVSAPTGDKYEIPAAATRLIVEGVQTETVELSETKKSHDIDQSAIKVYFGNDSGKIGEALPDKNVMLRLQAPGGVAVNEWTGLKLNGEYKIRVNVKDCKVAAGSNMEVSDFFANVTITVKNPVKSLSVKEGATLTIPQGDSTVVPTWTYEITRANGDKTDIAAADITYTKAVDIIGAGADKTATFKTTVDGAEVTGTVTYSVVANENVVSQSFALNFGMLDATQCADVEAGKVVKLKNDATTATTDAETRFTIQSMSGGKIDGDNNEEGGRYFAKRLKCNGSSDKQTGNVGSKVGAPSYIKVHADGAGTLTIWAYHNAGAIGDGKTRGVGVYSGVTFIEAGNDGAGALSLENATLIGTKTLVPSKETSVITVTIPAAGDYYITHDAAMTYRYVQLDQLVDKEGNEAITLGGTKTNYKLTASHPQDTSDVKFKGTFKVGAEFTVDAGYTFKTEAINDVTCEKFEAETVSSGLSYWLGEVEITSGYTFKDTDLGEQTVTVKLDTLSTTYKITVESAISGVTGITASVKDTVATEVEAAEGKVQLNKTDVEVAVKGSNADASVALKTVKYRLASAAAGSETEIVDGTAAELGVGEYKLVVTGTVSVAGATPVDFTTEIDFTVTLKGSGETISAGDSEVGTSLRDNKITGTKIDIVAGGSGDTKVAACGQGEVTAQDTSGLKFTNGWLPGGGGRNVTITAKKAVTLTVYYTVSNGDFSSTTVTDGFKKSGYLQWQITSKDGTAGEVQSDTNQEDKYSNKAYAVTITLAEGDSCVLTCSSTSNRVVLFSVIAK